MIHFNARTATWTVTLLEKLNLRQLDMLFIAYNTGNLVETSKTNKMTKINELKEFSEKFEFTHPVILVLMKSIGSK